MARLKELTHRKLARELLRFGLVGAIGFLVDAAVLYVLVSWHVHPLLARSVSFPTALLATWLLNSRWTFGEYRDENSQVRQALGYVIVQCVGSAANYVVFALCLPITGASSLGAVAALAIGSAVGLFVNFVGSRLLVFRPSR